MPDDTFYGAETEIRIGRRANIDTPPTSWQAVDFMSLTVSPSQEWRERAKLGNPAVRQNVLDPIKPRKGFFRIGLEAVLDADSRMVPIWLRHCWGAPVTTAAGPLYAHAWASGAKAEQYFDILLRVGGGDVRRYDCVTLASISTAVGGEDTQDFNINLSLRGLRRSRLTGWPAGATTVAIAPAEAPILRALYEVDDVAATQTLSANFSYDRALAEGIYLSPTPTVSNNRPNGGAHTMSASFRAIGLPLDQIEDEETVFDSAINMLGVVSNHRIRFEQPQSMLQPAALPVTGPGMIERSWNSAGHQTPTQPASRVIVTNDRPSYAT